MKPSMTSTEREALLRHLRRRDSLELPTLVQTIVRNNRPYIVIAAKGVTVGIYAHRPDLNTLRRASRLPRIEQTEDRP